MTITDRYMELALGPIDSIDAAVFNGDIFFKADNIVALREMMVRWERRLKYNESIYNRENLIQMLLDDDAERFHNDHEQAEMFLDLRKYGHRGYADWSDSELRDELDARGH